MASKPDACPRRELRTDLWHCGPPRSTGRRQGFPSRFWLYFQRDFVNNGERGLHLFGGSAPDWPRVDNDPESQPDYLQDAFAPPIEPGKFDIVLCDPPYTKKFSDDWGVEQPSPKAVLHHGLDFIEVACD